jgi:hypothetical protein
MIFSTHNLDLTAHDIHNRQTFVPSTGFEPAIPVSDWQQTYAVESTAAGIGDYGRQENLI